MLGLTGLAFSAATMVFGNVTPFLLRSLAVLMTFAVSRAVNIPKYIKILFLIYKDSDPQSQTRKYLTGTLLVLSSLLAFMAHSFIPFTGVPVIGLVTTPIALLLASVVILASLDVVVHINEPYIKNIKLSYTVDFQEMQDDLLTLRNLVGPSWQDLTKKLQKIFDDLAPKIAELGDEVFAEIDRYFSSHLSELVVYLDRKNSAKIILNESDIKIITESLEPWKKVGGSFVLGALTGAGTGMAASSVAAASLAPAVWWTPFVPGAIQTILVGGRTVVGAATFSACTVAAPIAIGLTVGTGIFSAAMFAHGKIEKKKLSQFLADVIIASLPMLRADGEFSEDEKSSIQQLLTNPSIYEQDKNRVNTALSSHDTFDDIITKNILHEEKADKALIRNRLILAISWEIAKADGKIDEQEVILHNRMAKILCVPEETTNEVRCLITPKFVLSPC